jgi:dipeptidase E
MAGTITAAGVIERTLTQMGKIVAYGGGEWHRTLPIQREILRLTGKSSPKVLFLPTASKDNEESCEAFANVYRKLGARVDLLLAIRGTPSAGEIREKIGEANAIFVGGGNTLMMMRRWKFLGIGRQLLKAYREGKVLSGASAGSICWFESGHSDSMRGYGHDPWDYISVSGFGLLPGFNCPHYHYEDRTEKFQQMVVQRGGHGIAMDDGAAVEVVDGEYRVLACLRGAGVYSVRRMRGRIVQVRIPAGKEFRPLGEMYGLTTPESHG